ncbi:MAG: GTPase domain-containing protein [Candidatus Heimdallarchaeota archaeon]
MSSKSISIPPNVSSESILCLSYFDSIIGPTIFYSSSPIDKKEHPDIGRILEFQETEGSFIFSYRKYQTINHIFYIDSEFARGGKDLLMITYMIKAAYFKGEISDVYRYIESKIPELEDLARDLNNLKALPGILHSEKSRKIRQDLLILGSQDFQNQFLELFYKYYQKISPEIPVPTPLIARGALKKLYIFGPPKSGKTTLLKNLEVIQFLEYKDPEKKRDLINKIYDFIIENIEILTYECIDEDREGKQLKLYEQCLDNAQGFILIFNASKKDSLEDTIDMFNIILNRCLDKGIFMPILIIGNKFYNKEEIKPEDIYEHFNITELANCGMIVHYSAINVLNEDEKIIEALRWILKQLI